MALFIASAQGATAASIAESNGWTPIYTVIPRPVDMLAVLEGAKSGKTIPTFTNTIKSPVDGMTYSFTIVGSDPTKKAATTNLKYFPIAIRWHFPGGVVIDPTKPGCKDTVAVASRLFNGPLFTSVTNTSNGVTLPKTQTTDAFQIAEFFEYTKNSNYHVLLSSTQRNVTIVDVTAPSGSLRRAHAAAQATTSARFRSTATTRCLTRSFLNIQNRLLYCRCSCLTTLSRPRAAAASSATIAS